MKKSRIAAAAAVVVLAASSVAMYRRADASQVSPYRFATVTRGNLQATVSATGALSAVTTVQVGTQVSGQISALYADFNQKVKKGQLLARIDPTLQQQAVQDAQAGVEKAQSQSTMAQQEYDREKTLYDSKVITATEFGTAQSNYEVGKADLKSAQIALDKAKQNLAYTNIYAPIDGVIVARTVDVGQTVAASLSAPELFLIANDLSQMQILANVDESDIGQIAVGQPVTFSVQAYPNRSFTGTVQQVRLQSTTQDNVVNYTTVISVSNTDGKLLPGMTATVSFLTGSATNALLVPNAALRFRATPEMMAEAGLKTRSASGNSTTAKGAATSGAATGGAVANGGANGAPTNGGANGGQRSGSNGARGGSGGARPSVGMLWYLDKTGKLAVARVKTGLTDGQTTEIIPRDSTTVQAGQQVITGTTVASTSSSSSSASANPLQPQSGGRRG
ncbi:MAG TPA: efflux RND transporter periplasmic adaptor subunit, partial [Gemmatimonadaceae bacterium]|nr:efflux RND transporter periplasmic adaptor subunit [Gemmatimonadaceae bacterium]